MSEAEVEADVRFDTVWQRRTWRLGPFATAPGAGPSRFDDPFHVFSDEPRHRDEALCQQERALLVLDLTPPVTVGVVKARYKQLVKRYHPDANDGNKAAEERFKEISEAYRVVMKFLQP